MMKKYYILIFFIANAVFSKAQTDSSSVKSDSVTIPKYAKSAPLKYDDEPPALGEIFKPKIAIGIGMLSFNGDLYAKHFQAPWTARIGYDLTISQRLWKPLQLNFNILFGKLGANEWLNNRQENFQSEIRAGGISLLYDFGNFIPDKILLRPWVSIGINSFEFLSKTDRYDKNGNEYFYWSDGSIKNIDEASPTASLAININRDYTYETDIRESNKDGFGKYQERAWAIPVGAGALMHLNDRFDFKIGMQYYFTTTDYIDGISNKSVGNRVGNKHKDNFVYTSFSLQYDLVRNKKSVGDTMPDNYYDDVDILALDNGDYDEDGVKDFIDKCQGTPKGVQVTAEGCPLDDDKDGVPNYEDDELETAIGSAVNARGVALDDEYWQNWYNQYMDTNLLAPNTEIVGNYFKDKNDSIASINAKATKADKEYTVELARYTGPVPSEEMTNLLSIGDVKSTMLEDGSTVLYTAGNYKELKNAVKRKDEFIANGNKNAQIGYFKGGKLVTMTNEEIASLLDAKENTTNTTTVNTNTTTVSNTDIEDANANNFGKGDIVYRVQLGAYKNRISKEIFKNAGNVLELPSENNVFRYATKGVKTIQEAANLKADLVVEGYPDAFITAYKDGKRIPMTETKATVVSKVKEDITNLPTFSSVDKNQIVFKIQLGSLRKAGVNDMEEKIKSLQDVEKQGTGSGMIRYTSGTFNSYTKADAYRKDLTDKGFAEAFVIALFKGEVISIQEAQELLK